MSAMQIAGRELDLNAKGFLADFGAWDKEVAEVIAADEGLALSECHWKVIDFLRDYYATHEIPAPPRLIVKEIGHELETAGPCRQRDLKALFPDGGCKQACRIAGLPDYYCFSC